MFELKITLLINWAGKNQITVTDIIEIVFLLISFILYGSISHKNHSN